ncbi:MAG: hypothetical protein GTO55_09850 [Armatimonadetes bacterium]|nr:hypothetical protein [Armatimonadota bacterium]NIM24546.1 hypothetical protein [Armatimonadota bacterium]NIM68420.1 hypothetical protein [Armatimonadota bacterium]NIM76806.1 hypothetical protein [Armatimonadota bacterium]NIN06619.1 hypothetical protein [Armatimonadota bacterium]
MAFRIVGLVLFAIGFSLACAVLGYAASIWYLGLDFWVIPPAVTAEFTDTFVVSITVAFIALGLLVGIAMASVIYRQFSTLAANLVEIPSTDKLAVLLGFVVGLMVAILLSPLFELLPRDLPMIRPALVGLVYLLCVYGGITVAMGMKSELAFLLTRPPSTEGGDSGDDEQKLTPKLFDTNVIIDGRIADICRAGFVEGPLYIPDFVLEELHLIADSSDNLRRARGRRGLDILAQLQKEQKKVRVYDHYKSPMPRGEAVDAKLVRLAKELEASIVTNDFNLNKVASLQGITVLNVNELASALRPIVLPGEDLTVTVVREGKELNQGVAYLDDGTMVVVEAGKTHINETLNVVVSSVLQTVAGKMIFANIKSRENQSGPRQQPEDARNRMNRGPNSSSSRH